MRQTDDNDYGKIKTLPVHSLLLTSMAYPARHVTQSDAKGPVQPLHDWWQAAAMEHMNRTTKCYNKVIHYYPSIFNATQSAKLQIGHSYSTQLIKIVT